MAFRFTSDVDTTYIRDVPLGTSGHTSSVPRTGMRLSSMFATGYTNMASATNKYMCVQVQYYCTETDADFSEKVIACLYAGTPFSSPSIHHAVTIRRTSGVWYIKWYLGSTSVERSLTGYVPTDKWLSIFLTYQRHTTTAANGMAMLTVYEYTTNSTLRSSLTTGNLTDLATLEPTKVAFGNVGTFASGSRTARGIKSLFISSVMVADGNAGAEGVTPLDAATLVTTYGYLGVLHSGGNQYAVGHYCGGGDGSWMAYNRPPNNATTSIGLYDRFSASFAGYWGWPQSGTAVAGTIPFVNPLDAGYPIKIRCSRNTNVGEIGAIPSLTLSSQPIGPLGTKTKQLVKVWNGGTPSSTIRVGAVGNSRAMFAKPSTLITNAGVVASRFISTGYNEYGFLAQDALWNGAVIGSYKAAIAEETIGGFGLDTYTNGILCKDSVGTTVAASTAFQTSSTTSNSTLGSRGWVATRDPTTVDGSAHAYRGNANMRMLKPGYSARWMWRPEAGTPNTAAFKVGVVLRGYWGSDDVAEVRKITTATAQNGAAVANTLTQSNVAVVSTLVTSKAATAVVNPVFVDARIHPVTAGSITVNDLDNAWADLKAGDLLNRTSTYDQVVVRSVTGLGTATCVITYEWMMTTNPAISENFSWIPATESYKTIEVDFTAGEATGSQWRGIEIKASNTAGRYGVLVACVYAYRTDGNGIILQQFGRHGCGQHVQAARHGNVISPRDNKTELQRCMDILQTDVMFVTSADQGFESLKYADAFRLQISRYTTARPTLECVLAMCMSESANSSFTNDGPPVQSPTKNGIAAAQYYVAQQDGLPCVGWWLDAEGWQPADTFITGHDIGESNTHPLTSSVVKMWMDQLTDLVPNTSASLGSRLFTLGLL